VSSASVPAWRRPRQPPDGRAARAAMLPGTLRWPSVITQPLPGPPYCPRSRGGITSLSKSLPLRTPVAFPLPPGATVTAHDLDRQPPGSGPQLGRSLASYHRAGARTGALQAACAGSPGWMSHGACRGEDPELFFPVTMTGPALAQVRSAKAVCGRCPVRPDCLSYALVTGQDDGIWGGTTTEERWPTRRQRRRPPALPSGSG
jgi:WhiB family transcriptional regulator, redox-sensing transcriptional regulator